MSRSLKKGPFADESLLKKVDAANASGDKLSLIHIFTIPGSIASGTGQDVNAGCW